ACLLVGMLALQRPWQYLRADGRESGGAAGFALLTGVTIAAYSAVDSVGVRGTETWIYAALLWTSCVVFLWAWVFVDRRLARSRGIDPAPDTGCSRRRAGFGGLITLAAYLLILGAYQVAPLTAVAPLRESAIVLASGWGAFRMREAADRRDAVRRVSAAS